VTRTTIEERRRSADDPELDPYAPIIADIRATMSAIKCASSERVLRLGISMAQLHILYTLQRTGEMTMSRLADILNVSLSNATGLIDRIEERGFVERTRVAEDRRVVLIRVTESGSRALDEIDALNEGILRSVLGSLGRSQLSAIAAATRALRTALTATAAAAPLDRHPPSIPSPRSTVSIPRGDRSLHLSPPRKD
jgi:DNA-binding MarR family transcriptional regulator